MTSSQLVFGAGHNDRTVSDVESLLREYREDTGCYYLDYIPVTPQSIVVPEDVAVTLLVNSQVRWQAFRSLQLYGHTIQLDQLPQKPLEETTSEERAQVAHVIAEVATWPGFAASVATKVLHKKRPDLIPILDNQAIFGAYMYSHWPQKPARSDSVKREDMIRSALDWIAFDITRPQNERTWGILREIETERTRTQLFDSVWWMYFRRVQPV